MSLCIAAACQDRGKSRVVIATDWKASAGIAAAEIQDKLYWIGDYMPVLIAGTITRAIELKDTYKQYLAILGGIDGEGKGVLGTPVQEIRPETVPATSFATGVVDSGLLIYMSAQIEQPQYSPDQQKLLFLYDTLRESLMFKKYYAHKMKDYETWTGPRF